MSVVPILTVPGLPANIGWQFTIANSGTVIGYSESSFGAVVNPSYHTRQLTGRIQQTGSLSGSYDFRIQRLGIWPQGVFTSVQVLDGGGSPTVYTSAGVSSFVQAGGATIWTWGTGATPMWDATDTGLTGTLTFTP